ncbi:MAG: sigma-70 family RNA polymerase sigma factor [Verrucomicrobiaceae bacterium]|nr:sigma-70 family RNA polymerase sigma factor [Verrucomicrobiaceae bacterium]
MDSDAKGQFPPTDWTLISRLRSRRESVAHAALEELCERYHYPLYCFIRRRGLAHHDAQDALHDFLAKLLRNHSLKTTREESGSLRGFLCMALSRFLANRHRDRANERLEVSLDALREVAAAEDRFQREHLTDEDTPERVFERKWAQELLRHVLRQMEDVYRKRGRLPLYRALRPVVLAGGSLAGEDIAALADSLGMSPGALRTALSRFLDRYRALIRQEVGQTIGAGGDVEAELACLAAAFRE